MNETDETPKVASWRSPKTAIRASATQGRGVYATTSIAAGELVAVKGGYLVDGARLRRMKPVIGDAELQVASDLFLIPSRREEHDAVMMFLNHSCAPNAGVRGNILFVARREIEAGEEVTIDYAMIDDGDFEMTCRCGEPECRGTIHGRDWQRPELQRRYRGFFSSYLEDEISRRQQAAD